MDEILGSSLRISSLDKPFALKSSEPLISMEDFGAISLFTVTVSYLVTKVSSNSFGKTRVTSLINAVSLSLLAKLME